MVYIHLLLCSALDLCLLDCAGPFEVCQTVLCNANNEVIRATWQVCYSSWVCRLTTGRAKSAFLDDR